MIRHPPTKSYPPQPYSFLNSSTIPKFGVSTPEKSDPLVKKKNRILTWFAIVFGLFAFQTFTYLTVSQRQLKNKLLSNYFTRLPHRSDSLFVRDFVGADCFVGDPKVYLTHDLQNDEAFLKTKLKVRYIHFDNPEHFSWYDTTEKRFNLLYDTYATRYDWTSFLFNLYGANQTETLIIDKKHLYSKNASYHWCLLFWIKTFEHVESRDV